MSIEGVSEKGAAAVGRFRVGEPARWVTGFKNPPPDAGLASEDTPTDQLLVDRQLFPKKRAHYSRHAQRLNNAQGVEALSQVRLNFDPAIEQLVVHSVRVWRDGVATEHADAENFKILQRESNLERQLYDGRMSALLLLEDVRPGDVIDIASTRVGDHPQLASHFFTAFASDYPVPVKRWSASVLVGEDSPLRWRCAPEDDQPVTRELKGGWTLHRWLKEDLPACEFEPNTPGWHLQGSAIEFTDFADWSEVASWVCDLWGKPDVPEELKDIAREIARDSSDEVERADKAVAFVRDEIRYLGLEDGIGSLQPCPVADVLRRRFGDCKDKTRLLCLLLRILKIPAAPMLVHTMAGRAVEEMLPSPGAFDHVIACAKIDGKTVWIDPTRRSMAKTVTELPPPHYGLALPVSAKAKGLRAIPETPANAALLVVKETYKLEDREKPAELTVEQTASGYEAEHLREVFGSLGKARYRELREAQLRETYPQAKAVGEWEMDFDPDNPSPTTREHFEISGFVHNEGNGTHAISFGPNSLRGRLPGTPHEGEREAPWALPFPCRIRHEVHVDLPSAIANTDESHQIDSETFGYKTSLSVDGDKADAVYRYWSKADHVRRDQLPTFRADYDQLGKYVNAVLQLDQSHGVWKSPKDAGVEPRKRRSGSSSSRHQDAKRKKIFNILGTIGVIAVVIGVFSSVSDEGKLPEPPAVSRPKTDPMNSAAYQAVYGSGDDESEGAGSASPTGVADSAIPAEDDGFVPIPENQPTGGATEEIKASLLDLPEIDLDDQPDDPKYQDLKSLDLKL